MREIFFATTSVAKVSSLERAFEPYGIVPKQVNIELPELQTFDIEAIVRHKAEAAFDYLKKPVIVQDSGFSLSAWPGFPGPFAKFVLNTIGLEGILHLAKDRERTCEFQEYLAYHDGSMIRCFESKSVGVLTNEPRGVLPKDALSGLWQVFVPRGYEKTIAEMTEGERSVWRKERGNTSAVLFAEWFSNHEIARNKKARL